MQPTRPSDVKTWCLAHEFHPNRTLGQNFLVDRNILDAIVAAAELKPGDAVLEVGPGLGAVTGALLAAGVHVTAIEKDRRLAAWLRESLGEDERLTLLEADMLDVSLDTLLLDDATGRPRFSACVSNLPYSVGTRILLELCRHPLAPPRLVVTVQREVAERLAADAGSKVRGQAGVWVRQNYDVSLLRTIKPTCFWPRPEIASTLVRLERHERLPMNDEARRVFDALTRHAFMHRRKQMVALLRLAPPALALADDRIEAVLTQAGIEPTSRPEALTDAQWASLTRVLAAGAETLENI